MNPSSRALNHKTDVSQERPLILCPGCPDNPRDHIDFHNEIPKGITPRGKVTVGTLGLDRRDHEPRLKRFSDLVDLRDLVLRWRRDRSPAARLIVARARAALAQATQPTAPWSAMAQDYLRNNPPP
jgi:hypothetical protein